MYASLKLQIEAAKKRGLIFLKRYEMKTGSR